ncbi:MAG: tetratricopeptide repeat protein [Planctomycetes bacterium]|nr:tetratricopeptide repeat protein [Planctomycetota bacterium]
MERTSNKQYILLIYVILALVTAIAFEQVRQHEFVSYDDYEYVTENPQVNKGLTRQSIVWSFTANYASNWHPATWLSHMLDCQLFGLNAGWHHLVNLFFHIVNTLLLFYVLKKMTSVIWPSAFVAAAFALHPLHVESVAWVAERKDVLSTFFWLLTIAAYIYYANRPSIRRYLLVFLFFAIGLMAKPMVVTLPFVLLLLDYWPLHRLSKRVLLEKIPLLVLVVISCVITLLVQQRAGSMEQPPLGYRISNVLVSYIQYIDKMIYPADLAVLYPVVAKKLLLWQPIASFVILVVISAGIIRTAGRRKYLTVGWLWYLGTLVPVVGFVQVGLQSMADRYTYLPSIGIFIIVAWGVTELSAKLPYRKVILGIIGTIVLLAMLVCTRLQVGYWQNNLALYEHALEVTENNYVMHNNFGDALYSDDRIDEALMHFDQALQISPKYTDALNNKGRVFIELGKIDEAIAIFNEVLQLKSDSVQAFTNFGVALKKQDKIDEAIEKWKKALQIKPDYPGANYNIGLAMAQRGQYDAAVRYFNDALTVKPDWPEVLYNLGGIYIRQGKLELAAEQCAEALRLKPDYLKANVALANILVQLGRIQPALNNYYKILQRDPDSIDVLNSIAWILAATGDAKLRNPAEAIKFAQKVCELTNYEDPSLLDTLAVAYASAGRFAEAIETSEKALVLTRFSKQKGLSGEIQNRMKLYKNNQSFVEKPLNK